MNEQITVMKDENLGGVEREYREVRRKAAVGEWVKIVSNNMLHGIPTGTVGVLGLDDTMEYDEYEFYVGMDVDPDPDRDYVVLEPTDVIHVNGERLRMVDRPVNVGDRVIIVKNNEYFRREPYKLGSVYSVKDALGSYIRKTKEYDFGISVGHYCVLEPVESVKAAERTEIERLTADLAALAVKYTEMERRVVALEAKDAEQLPAVFRDQEPPTRDEIVERAKADVAELLRKHQPSFWPEIPGEQTWWIPLHRAEFVINRDKRTVAALVRRLPKHGGKVVARGIAKCAPGDVFNSHIGRAIALRRALGLEVPSEYVNAPKPTEVRVGDIVEYDRWYEEGGEVTKRFVIIPSGSECTLGHQAQVGSLIANRERIVDDSREDETEVSA